MIKMWKMFRFSHLENVKNVFLILLMRKLTLQLSALLSPLLHLSSSQPLQWAFIHTVSLKPGPGRYCHLLFTKFNYLLSILLMLDPFAACDRVAHCLIISPHCLLSLWHTGSFPPSSLIVLHCLCRLLFMLEHSDSVLGILFSLQSHPLCHLLWCYDFKYVI